MANPLPRVSVLAETVAGPALLGGTLDGAEPPSTSRAAARRAFATRSDFSAARSARFRRSASRSKYFLPSIHVARQTVDASSGSPDQITKSPSFPRLEGADPLSTPSCRAAFADSRT